MRNNSNRNRTVENRTRKPGNEQIRKPENRNRTTEYRTRKPGNEQIRKPVNRNGQGTSTRSVRHYTPESRVRVRRDHQAYRNHSPVRHNTGHQHYRTPKRVNVYWTHNMYRDYRIMYPDFHYWYYPVGYRIVNVPAYRAYFHMGEVRNVYGRVHEVWYSWSTDEYFLYFGGSHPYQDFTVIIEGRHARRFSRHPEMFFSGRYIWVTGLVSTFDGRPEIMVKRRSQIHLY